MTVNDLTVQRYKLNFLILYLFCLFSDMKHYNMLVFIEKFIDFTMMYFLFDYNNYH